MDEGEPMDVQVDGDSPQPPPDKGRERVHMGQASSSSAAPVVPTHRGPGSVANVVSSSGNGPGPDQGPDGIGILAPGRQQQQDGVREIPGWATQGPRSHSKPSPDQPPFLVPAVQRGVQDEQHANMDALRREAEEARRQMAAAHSELDLVRQQVPMVLQHVEQQVRSHVNSLEQRLAEALESRGPAAQSQGVPSNVFAAPPQGVFSNLFTGPAQQPQHELRFRPPQPGAEDVEVSQNKRPGDDDAPPGHRLKVVSKEDAQAESAKRVQEAMQQEEAQKQQLGQIWPHLDKDDLLMAKNLMKVMTANGDTAIDRAMGRFFTNPEFMKGLKKQAKEEGKSLHDIKDKWVKQLFAWMKPSGAPEPTLPPPEPAPSEAPAAKTKKTREASRSRTRSAAQEPVPSEAPAAEEEKARPTKSETAKPKPSRAPRAQSARARKREESIETVPSTSVPPRGRLEPEEEGEEGGPKPKSKPKAKAQLGKTAKALKETQQAKKARIMEIQMDKRYQEAKKRGRQAANSEPPMPVILPTVDDQEAVYKFNPAVLAQARQELNAALRSASATKGKKEATPSPAPKQTVKKPRANSGSTAPHRTTLPVNALLTGHGKPKAKGRPRKTPLETIPETPAPVKKGRGRPKKVVVVDNRLVVPSPILPYNDVGNDPYLIKSH